MDRDLQGGDRFANAVFRDELRRLNSHLPKNRRTLKDLLEDPSPFVSSVSGHPIKMKRDELEDLSRAIAPDELARVKLPIILLRRRDLGIGAFTVLGDPFEEYVIMKITQSFTGEYEQFRTRRGSIVAIYKPQVSLLLRRFHSLVTIGFGSSGIDTTP